MYFNLSFVFISSPGVSSICKLLMKYLEKIHKGPFADDFKVYAVINISPENKKLHFSRKQNVKNVVTLRQLYLPSTLLQRMRVFKVFYVRNCLKLT